MRQILQSVATANPELVNVATQNVVATQQQQQQADPNAAAHHHHQAVATTEPWNRYQTGTDAAHAVHQEFTAGPMDPTMTQYHEIAVPHVAAQQIPQQPQQQQRGRGRGAQQQKVGQPGSRQKGGGLLRTAKDADQSHVAGQQPGVMTAATGPVKNTVSWESRFQDLALHKARKGTCNVSQKDDPALNRWIANQRKQRRLLLEGKTSALTEERIDMLESIGFEWGGRGRAGGKTGQRRAWDEWLEDLAAWKGEHGDCLVPQKHPSGLGLWVAKQRQNFRLWMNGQPSPMTRERVASLEALGFHFQSVLPPKTPWDEWLDQLKAYKEKHGDCRVRTGKGTEYAQLGKWVDRQRQHYSLRKKGKGKAMTDERIRQLEEAGFEWTVPRTGRPPKPKDPEEEERRRKLREQNLGPDGLPIKLGKRPGMTHKEKWDSRFEELLDYKKQHASTRVPSGKRRDGTFSSLGKWCDHQRQLYKRRREGKKCSLTDDRLQKLEDMGFEWILREEIADGTLEALSRIQKEDRPAKRGRKRKEVKDNDSPIQKSEKKRPKTISHQLAAAGLSSSSTTNDGKNLSGAQNEKWLVRLDELRKYKKKFGNCRVPAGKCKEKNYSQLGKWVDHQRQQYRLRSIGKPSTLTDARLEKLVDLGFEFVVTRRLHKGRAPPHQPKDKANGQSEDQTGDNDVKEQNIEDGNKGDIPLVEGTSETVPVYAETTEVAAETTEGASETVPVYGETTEVAVETTEGASETVPVYAETTEVAAETTEGASETVPVYAETTEVAAENAEVTLETVAETAVGAGAGDAAGYEEVHQDVPNEEGVVTGGDLLAEAQGDTPEHNDVLKEGGVTAEAVATQEPAEIAAPEIKDDVNDGEIVDAVMESTTEDVLKTEGKAAENPHVSADADEPKIAV